MDTLDKEFWEKREAAMKRFMAAKERKKARVAEITKSLCDPFGSPYRGQKPSLPLRKAPPFSPSLSFLRNERM